MEEHTSPAGNAPGKTINWWKALLWAVFSFGFVVLLASVVAFVLHEKVNRGDVFVTAFFVAVLNGILGHAVSVWNLKFSQWVIVLVLTIGSAWAISLVPFLGPAKHPEVAGAFMGSFAFWLGTVGDLSRYLKSSSSNAPPGGHPDNM